MICIFSLHIAVLILKKWTTLRQTIFVFLDLEKAEGFTEIELAVRLSI